MLAHIFRPSHYTPSPVTSICSNQSTIVAFRRNGVMEFYDSKTFRKYFNWNLNYEIIDSYFLNLNTVLALTKSDRIIYFDLVTMEVMSKTSFSKLIYCHFRKIEHSDLSYYHISKNNELFFYYNNSDKFIIRFKTDVISLSANGYKLIIGTADGFVHFTDEDDKFYEIEIKTKPLKVVGYDFDRIVVGGENGFLYFIDINNCIILDKIEIRQNPLTCIVVLNNNIYVSGEDSRICCVGVVNNRLTKSFQGDPHFSDTLCMIVDNDRVVSSGEDCNIVVSKIKNSSFRFLKVFDTSLSVGSTDNYFFTVWANSISFHKIDGIVENNSLKCQTSHNDLISYKISENVLETINQNETKFKTLVSFAVQKGINSYSVSKDLKYIAWSNKFETGILKIIENHEGDFSIKIFDNIESTRKVVINENFLIVQTFNGFIKIFKISEKLEFIKEISDICHYKDNIFIFNNQILLPHSKIIIELENFNTFEIDFKGDFINCFEDNDSGIIISEDDDLVYFTSLSDKVNTVSYEKSICTSSKEIIPFRNILYKSGEYYANSKYLYKIESPIVAYDIGHLIHGLAYHENDLIIVQTSLKSYMEKCKKGIYKEKYSNK